MRCLAPQHQPMAFHGEHRKVDVRLHGKGNSNYHSARPVHLIITRIKWIRTSGLSIKDVCEMPVRYHSPLVLTSLRSHTSSSSDAHSEVISRGLMLEWHSGISLGRFMECHRPMLGICVFASAYGVPASVNGIASNSRISLWHSM